MAEQATYRVDHAPKAASGPRPEAVDHPVADAADLGRLIVHLLGAPIWYSLDLAAAQAELFHASVAWWSGSSGEAAPGPDRRRPARRRGRSIRTVMKLRCPVVAPPEETVQKAVARMAEEACGSVLVCNGDRLCGIFTERDLMIRVVGRGRDPGKTQLGEVMTRDPDRIESTATMQEALRLMDGLAYQLPVVEDGRAVGLISMDDLPPEIVVGMLPELEQRRALAERMR